MALQDIRHPCPGQGAEVVLDQVLWAFSKGAAQ